MSLKLKKWSRAGSNRRPNRQLNSFLHVYLPIVFRATAGRQLPTATLFSIKVHLLIKTLSRLCLLFRCLLAKRR